MKRYIAFFLIISPLICFSQDFEIKGKIVDEDGSPLGSATIYAEKVADSSLISYTISDRQGSFSLKGNTEETDLGLFISYSGYELFHRTLQVKKQMDIDTLVLKLKENLLEEVLIDARRSPVTFKKDTLEFNADSFHTRPNANLEELLEVLPGVEVDRDGNITVNGKPVKSVLVNGEPFFGGDHRIATKNLPREIIDKVQVMDSKTKAEEFAGRPGDPENKRINVTFKKDKNKGYFARATAGGGTDERYELNAMANFFTDKTQASVISNSNNINSPGYTFAQDMLSNRVPVGGKNGITKAESAGATLRHKWDRWRKVNADYFFGRNDTEGRTRISRENILPDSRYFSNSEEQSNRLSDSHRLNAGFGFAIGRNHIDVSSGFTGNYDDSFRSSTTESLNQEGELINSAETFRNSKGESNSFSNRINFTRRLGELGSGSSLGMSFSQNHASRENESWFNSRTEILEEDEQQTRIQDQLIDEENIDDKYSFNISNHRRINDKLILGLTYSVDHANTTNRRFVFDGENGESYDQLNSLLSEDSEIKNTTHKPSLDISYHKSFAWIFNGQFGFQHTRLQSENFMQNTSLDNSYNSFFGTGYLKYATAASKSLSLRYSSSVGIPSIEQMQPRRDQTDPLNIVQGNPNLKPVFNQKISIMLMYFELPDMNGWNANLDLNLTDNNIVPIVKVGDNLVRTTTYTNVDGGMNASATVYYRGSIVEKPMKLGYGSSMNVTYNKNVGFLNDVKYNSRSISYRPSVNLDYSIEELIDIVPRYSLTYNTSSYDISQDRDRDFSNHEVGLRAISYWPKNVIFTNDLGWNYYSNVSPGLDNSSFLWNLSLGYQFLNDDATLNLKIYDLLKQSIDTRRIIGDDYIQDINSLILKRYFMLSFTYKLGNFGGGSNSGGQFNVISR